MLGRAGRIHAGDLDPDLALIDLEADARGIEAAAEISGRGGVPVVYLVGDVDERVLQRARETDPFGYVVKPADSRQLRLTIDAALSRRAANRRERERQDADRRRLSDAREQAELMRSVFDSMNEGVMAIDERGEIHHLQPQCGRILRPRRHGYRPRRVVRDPRPVSRRRQDARRHGESAARTGLARRVAGRGRLRGPECRRPSRALPQRQRQADTGPRWKAGPGSTRRISSCAAISSSASRSRNSTLSAWLRAGPPTERGDRTSGMKS